MSQGITPGQIRFANRMQIYHYIYNHRDASVQEICRETFLSRPTVVKQLEELLEDGLLRHSGLANRDQVGRKGNAFSITENCRAAAGVHLTENAVQVCLINLYGEITACKTAMIRLPGSGPDSRYYLGICSMIREMLETEGIPEENLLGAGIAVPCPVSSDGERVLIPCPGRFSGMTAAGFSRELSVPCSLIRETGASAAAEMFAEPEMDNALYLSLSEYVGTVMISDRRILKGRYGHGALAEHIQARPGGRLCWCGRHGCIGTECSLASLLQEGEGLSGFFDRVRSGVPEAADRWDRYLYRLSGVLRILLLLYDTQIILGGLLGPFLIEDDFEILYRNIREQLFFELPEDFLCRCAAGSQGVLQGAALPLIWSFLENPCGNSKGYSDEM